MDLTQRSESFVNDDQSWLGSAHATDTGETVTLAVALFDLATAFPNGFIPSGVFIGKVTATGKYGPYDDAAVDGREVARGILLHGVRAKNGDTTDKIGTRIWHGQVIEAKLPAGSGVNANGKADLKLIDFV